MRITLKTARQFGLAHGILILCLTLGIPSGGVSAQIADSGLGGTGQGSLEKSLLTISGQASQDLFHRSFDSRKVRREIDEMVSELKARLGAEKDLDKIVQTLNRYLFQERGYSFHPGPEGLQDPRDILVPDVIERKKGICMGLAALYLILTERLELPVEAVVVPGHVFVRYEKDGVTKNVELTEAGRSRKDQNYSKAFSIPEDTNFFLRSLNKKEMLGTFLNNLASVYLERNRPEEAARWAKEAIHLNPVFSEPYHNLGTAYNRLGLKARAVRAFRKASALNPKEAETRHSLGSVFMTLGRVDAAIREFRQAVLLQPGRGEFHYKLAAALDQKGKLDQALEEFRTAVSLDPRNERIHCDFGLALAEKGLIREAIAEYLKSISLNPSFAEAHNNLAVAYCLEGSFDRAFRHLERASALGLTPNPRLTELLKTRRK